jgi:hypothetical protein
MGSNNIYIRKSFDYEDNFNRTRNLSRNNGSSLSPQLAAFDNNVYIVWTDDTKGSNEIHFRKSSDRIDIFGGTRNLSDNFTASFTPQISLLDKDHVYITWNSNVVNGTNLLFRASGDAGDHFDNPPRLSNISKSSNSQYMIAYQKDCAWFGLNKIILETRMLFSNA